MDMRIQDARGNWLPLKVPHLRYAGGDERLARRMAWGEYARRDAASRSHVEVLAQQMVLSLCCVGLMYLAAMYAWDSPFTAFLLVALAMICFAGAWRVPASLHAARRRTLDQALTLMGYCPSCDYPLDGLSRDADGCIVCPECGGAWRPGEAPVCRQDFVS